MPPPSKHADEDYWRAAYTGERIIPWIEKIHSEEVDNRENDKKDAWSREVTPNEVPNKSFHFKSTKGATSTSEPGIPDLKGGKDVSGRERLSTLDITEAPPLQEEEIEEHEQHTSTSRYQYCPTNSEQDTNRLMASDNDTGAVAGPIRRCDRVSETSDEAKRGESEKKWGIGTEYSLEHATSEAASAIRREGIQMALPPPGTAPQQPLPSVLITMDEVCVLPSQDVRPKFKSRVALKSDGYSSREVPGHLENDFAAIDMQRVERGVPRSTRFDLSRSNELKLNEESIKVLDNESSKAENKIPDVKGWLSKVKDAGNLHRVPAVDPEMHELETSAWTYRHYPISNVSYLDLEKWESDGDSPAESDTDSLRVVCGPIRRWEYVPESPGILRPDSVASRRNDGSSARAEMRGSLVDLDASLDVRRDSESRPGVAPTPLVEAPQSLQSSGWTDVEEPHRSPSSDSGWDFALTEVMRRDDMTRMKSVAPPRRDMIAADESVEEVPRKIDSTQESIKKTSSEKASEKKVGWFRRLRRRVGKG